MNITQNNCATTTYRAKQQSPSFSQGGQHWNISMKINLDTEELKQMCVRMCHQFHSAVIHLNVGKRLQTFVPCLHHCQSLQISLITAQLLLIKQQGRLLVQIHVSLSFKLFHSWVFFVVAAVVVFVF